MNCITGFPNVEISLFSLEFLFLNFQCLSFLIQKEMVFYPTVFSKILKWKFNYSAFKIPKPCRLQRRMFCFCSFLKNRYSQVDVVAGGPSIKFTPLILLSSTLRHFLSSNGPGVWDLLSQRIQRTWDQSTTFNPLKSHRINKDNNIYESSEVMAYAMVIGTMSNVLPIATICVAVYELLQCELCILSCMYTGD